MFPILKNKHCKLAFLLNFFSSDFSVCVINLGRIRDLDRHQTMPIHPQHCRSDQWKLGKHFSWMLTVNSYDGSPAESTISTCSNPSSRGRRDKARRIKKVNFLLLLSRAFSTGRSLICRWSELLLQAVRMALYESHLPWWRSRDWFPVGTCQSWDL